MRRREISLVLRLLTANSRFSWLRMLLLALLGIAVLGSIDYQSLYRYISRIWLCEGRWICVYKPLQVSRSRTSTGNFAPAWHRAEDEIVGFMTSKRLEDLLPKLSFVEYNVSEDEHPIVRVSVWTKDKKQAQFCIDRFKTLFLDYVAAANNARDEKALSLIRCKFDRAQSPEEQASLREELKIYQEQLKRSHAENDWVYEEF